MGHPTLHVAMCLSALVLFAVAASAVGQRSRRQTSSSTCLDKYWVIDSHTMCLKSMGNLPTNTDIAKIVLYHNQKRSAVSPPATNMLVMQWYKPLAVEAAKWAAKCELTHENPIIRRYLPGRFMVGQNIVTQNNAPLDWSAVIDLWNKESAKFTHGRKNTFAEVGHYTQLVWAGSNALGCGWAKCDTTYFYVCNYGPAGNKAASINTPYINGSSGSACKSHRDANFTTTLCDCNSKLCLNGATLNLTTCECDCVQGVTGYVGPYCELNCTNAKDDTRCGTTPWVKSSCKSNPDAIFSCPFMCNVCPYVDDNYVQGSGPLFQHSGNEALHTGTLTSLLYFMVALAARAVLATCY